MNLFSDSVVTDVLCLGVVLLVVLVLLLNKRSLIEPLELWVLEAICWVRLLHSSPWLWEHTFVIRCKSMNLLNDTIVSDIFVVMLLVVLVLVSLLNQ